MTQDEPAFPWCCHRKTCKSGLTKREYFAAKAMESLVAHPEKYSVVRDNASCAEKAVQIADALLAELAKEAK